MSNVVEAKDPRGITVYCTAEQWETHIVAPTGHPMMQDNIDAIVETIESPDYIFESHDSDPPMDYREIYSKATPRATYHRSIPCTIVVVSSIGGSAEIITAYPAKKPDGGTKGEAIYIGNDET